MEYHLRFASMYQIQKYAGNELESSSTFFVSFTLIAVLGAGTKLLERHLPRSPIIRGFEIKLPRRWLPGYNQQHGVISALLVLLQYHDLSNVYRKSFFTVSCTRT